MSEGDDPLTRLAVSLEFIEEQLDTVKKTQDKIGERLVVIERQLSLYRTFIVFFKLVGLTVAFILTLKFGDIKALWSRW